MRLLIILSFFFYLKGYTQNWYTDGNRHYSSIEKILNESFFIKENKEDTLYLKIDDISSNFSYGINRSNLKKDKQEIMFISQKQLYNKLIDDYYDITYFFIDYNIARLQYINRKKNKVYQFLYTRKISGEWKLLEKKIFISRLMNNDYLWHLIRKKKGKKRN